MSPTEFVRPDLQALVSMAIGRLNAISEFVSSTDKPLPPKVAKNARECKGLVLLIIQEIHRLRETEKAAPVKKPK